MTRIEALQGSIRKWQAIAEGKESDHGHDDCALCVKYLEPEGGSEPVAREDAYCIGCPVAEDTGLKFCKGSPYQKYATTPNAVNAREMLYYLRRLLKKEEEAA